ncbi:hypothetical protein GZ77_02055 [Endozoicomonas montiporae]|uniref:Uncharacterized protein n=1 Tax=Endozoicomonas montiporae TaxID=1027273 RepID=A0A081NAH9_9GAMM|nr:hypothetical protein [Endozoicomonas montiporae]KEQ15452.1 hypothetical protein GZ77_02055 [Endozoicomonas montiporae]
MMNMIFKRNQRTDPDEAETFTGNHIVLLVVPQTDKVDGNELDNPDAIIVDPMLGVITEKRELEISYAINIEKEMNFSDIDQLLLSYAFFDEVEKPESL